MRRLYVAPACAQSKTVAVIPDPLPFRKTLAPGERAHIGIVKVRWRGTDQRSLRRATHADRPAANRRRVRAWTQSDENVRFEWLCNRTPGISHSHEPLVEVQIDEVKGRAQRARRRLHRHPPPPGTAR